MLFVNPTKLGTALIETALTEESLYLISLFFCVFFCFSTTAPPLHSENSTISTSVSKYYKCPEEALTPVMQRTIPIRDIPVIKDIACFPDPTWTEVNANMHCTPSNMEQVVR